MKNILKKLYEFQQACPEIEHDQKNEYSGYTYASLPNIVKVVRATMKPLNMGFTQTMRGDTLLTTIFDYESGESLESEINIPQDVQLKGMNDFQVLGSAITYLRRYALTSILGITAEKDMDARGEQKQGKKTNDKPWLNLFDKNGNETNIFKTIKTENEKEPISLERLRNTYKVSRATEKTLAEMGIK